MYYLIGFGVALVIVLIIVAVRLYMKAERYGNGE